MRTVETLKQAGIMTARVTMRSKTSGFAVRQLMDIGQACEEADSIRRTLAARIVSR